MSAALADLDERHRAVRLAARAALESPAELRELTPCRTSSRAEPKSWGAVGVVRAALTNACRSAAGAA
jgi:hypothetical protein